MSFVYQGVCVAKYLAKAYTKHFWNAMLKWITQIVKNLIKVNERVNKTLGTCITYNSISFPSLIIYNVQEYLMLTETLPKYNT